MSEQEQAEQVQPEQTQSEPTEDKALVIQNERGTFDIRKALIKVQGGRTYLPVSARIVWFRMEHPDWGIHTNALEINHEKQYAVFQTTIFDGTGRVMAMGTKKEDLKGFGDYIEKAETGSVGRALALCGFGTQFAPEIDDSDANRPGNQSRDNYQNNNDYRGGGNVRGNRGGNENRGDYGNENRGGYGGDRGKNNPADYPRGGNRQDNRPVNNNDSREEQGERMVDNCNGCGRQLTGAQKQLSVRSYGEPLCPECQKKRKGSGQQQRERR